MQLQRPPAVPAVCRGRSCLRESPEHGRENAAAEDGMDHAWPGWRDLPVITAPPHYLNGTAGERAEAAWLAKVSPGYPPGWIEAGGPIRTQREKYGTRHVPHWTPSGGSDMAVPAPGGEGGE
jgi:hypothetical protein